MNSADNISHKQLVDNIQSLQKLEQELYLNLEKLPHDSSSVEAQEEIVDKINSISQTRIGQFEQLNLIYQLLEDNVRNEKAQLKDQIDLIYIMEKHLTHSRTHISKNKNLNISNLRETEINTYYSKKYNAQYEILRIIAVTCIPLLILTILRKRYIIPSSLSNILGILVFVIGCIFVVPRVIDISRRNNMVFDEYDMDFNPNEDSNPDIDHQDNEDDLLKKYGRDLKLLEDGECLGPACCGKGMVYDNKKEMCIIEHSKKKEAFLAGQSTQMPGAELSDPATISKKLISYDKTGEYYSF